MSEPTTENGVRIIDIIAEGEIECGNCECPRSVDPEGEVQECPQCGDDAWDLYEAADARVP